MVSIAPMGRRTIDFRLFQRIVLPASPTASATMMKSFVVSMAPFTTALEVRFVLVPPTVPRIYFPFRPYYHHHHPTKQMGIPQVVQGPLLDPATTKMIALGPREDPVKTKMLHPLLRRSSVRPTFGNSRQAYSWLRFLQLFCFGWNVEARRSMRPKNGRATISCFGSEDPC